MFLVDSYFGSTAVILDRAGAAPLGPLDAGAPNYRRRNARGLLGDCGTEANVASSAFLPSHSFAEMFANHLMPAMPGPDESLYFTLPLPRACLFIRVNDLPNKMVQ